MDLQGEIKAKRDAAARARRLASGVSQEDTYRRLLGFAATLEAEADALEQRIAKPPAPQVTQIQMQVQQGPPAKRVEDDESDDPPA